MLPFALGSVSPSLLSQQAASVVSLAPNVFLQNVRSPVLRQWAGMWTPDAVRTSEERDGRRRGLHGGGGGKKR